MKDYKFNFISFVFIKLKWIKFPNLTHVLSREIFRLGTKQRGEVKHKLGDACLHMLVFPLGKDTRLV